ncbi:MAG: tRNA-(ms[2]io[6]A)-hydroxylase [Cytophagaceae bacterium]|jgi:tRNA-(ms[2]io[6]A)-hydroxylase|nr:tRNA-(ms[2]io[6]A)-hydroxylase [Cytophagaceae bacterium]
MLGLKLPTDPRWVDIATKNIVDILVDHAYCEQKAASSCISLIVLHSDKKYLVDTLTPIVSEEWSHFRMVLKELNTRGYSLGPQRKDEYVIALQALITKGGSPEQRLLDSLLVNALIEARSCERFRILSEEIEDSDLKLFYHELMKSEAGHYMTFIDIAKNYIDETKVKYRLDEFLAAEALIIESMRPERKRMH